MRSLDEPDFRSFRETAAKVLAAQSNWTTVNLALPDGQQIMNLLAPEGGPLPRIRSEDESVARIAQTMKRAVGDLVLGPSIKRWGLRGAAQSTAPPVCSTRPACQAGELALACTPGGKSTVERLARPAHSGGPMIHMLAQTRRPAPAHRRPLLFVAAACAAVVLGTALPAPLLASPPKGGVANIAMIGEPQTLDPMASTADLVGTIMQHVYELLYTYDADSNVVPMLAETLPTVSKDGLVYTIPLRHGVKFHNGKEMTSDDVLASLDRWMKMAPRGKAVAKEVKSVEAKVPYTLVITLNRPYAPLVAHLALSNGFAAIMAKESIAEPLTQFIGTGPYMFKERKPDQYVQLVRFDGYSARKEPASGYGGKREALLDELRFIPVPNANTRVEGMLAGQYQFADVLPVEAYSRLASAPNVKPVLTAPFGFPYLVLNTKNGPLTNVTLRQSVEAALNNADMMAAGFGDPKFYDTDANHYAKNTPFYSTAGTENYGKGDAKKAAALAAGAKYDGTPIKVLTSQQYDFHYRMALVMAENLKAAGYKVDMQVVDWSTLIQRRNDPALWDIYITHSAVLPEPTLTPPQLGDGAPGWWSSPAKDAALAAFNAEADPKKRAALWGKVQNVVFTEVPYIRVGDFNNLTARSAKLDGYVPMPWPFFWNTGLTK